MAGKPHSSRNRLLGGGISLYSRSAMYRKRFSYKKKKTVVKADKTPARKYIVKEIKGEDNGKTRNVPVKRAPSFYPTDDWVRRKSTRKNPKPVKLRPSITPGTVLIVLAGRHMGKRVVFLKQLDSGLLLVTGPFSINGFPLRRLSAAYVIATSARLDISTVNIPDNINDDYFRRSVSKQDKTNDMFADSKKSYSLSDSRKEDQRKVDSQLMPLVRAVPSMRQYLASKFSLKHGQFPHKMKF